MACKNDLYDIQQVNDEEGKAFAVSINGIFQSTSAKNNSGINKLFENIWQRFFNPNLDINAIENKEIEEFEKKKRKISIIKINIKLQIKIEE